MTSNVDTFSQIFGVQPTVCATAPGRVNLIGDHIDYLGGVVLPMAIGSQLEVLVVPAKEGSCLVWSDSREGEPMAFDADDLAVESAPERRWLNYPKGVLAGYKARGIISPPFRAAVFSDIPAGAGLSSSAAFATAFALAIEQLAGADLGVVERAQICQEAEHQFAGVPCGMMDQLAIGAGVEGCAVRIDCAALEAEPVPMPADLAVVIADTKVKHSLDDGQYRARREDCEEALEILGLKRYSQVTMKNVEAAREQLGDRLYRRARHAVSEIARVNSFATALRDGDLVSLGEAMAASHRSLRDDFEVSCAELDCLVAAAEDFGAERGMVGSRMTGGGFGGSTESLVRRDAAPALMDHLRAAALSAYGAEIAPFSSIPSAGATVRSLIHSQSKDKCSTVLSSSHLG